MPPTQPPLGLPLPQWQGATPPSAHTLSGRFCRLEPLAPQHAAPLAQTLSAPNHHAAWAYLPYGPFDTQSAFEGWLAGLYHQTDPQFYALINPSTQQALGLASYLRINPEAGSIEVGHLNFSPAMARTPMATEAMYLMMKQAFLWGYRRYEWKCNALNMPSRRAAQRLGLSYEGVFRNAAVIKGHNRDTAWFAAIDTDWPALQQAFLTWLAADNFTACGSQRSRLSELTAPLLVMRDTGFLGFPAINN
ncbi:MAG: hypothetical protein RL497_714 [Pseudomonadota bacterium]|jgi:RimJ/RimL family protein N-acetyltransferase